MKTIVRKKIGLALLITAVTECVIYCQTYLHFLRFAHCGPIPAGMYVDYCYTLADVAQRASDVAKIFFLPVLAIAFIASNLIISKMERKK
jgi:hypothetical protein